MLLLQSCLELRNSAHGSYYLEGLGALFHQEEKEARGQNDAQGLIFLKPPNPSQWSAVCSFCF